MKVYLVRHARGVPRAEWEGEELLRPLSPRGRAEALALADHLAAEPPARIVAAPPLRCQQTVEPLAVAHRVPVEVDERLLQSTNPARLLELLPPPGSGPVLLCTHGDVIGSLLTVLELAEPEDSGRIPAKKGSVWVVEGRGSSATRARYFEPVRRPRRSAGFSYSEREQLTPPTVRAAVLDLGSTSFTLLVADVSASGEVTPVVNEKVMLRLGAVMGRGGAIPREICERAVSVAGALHLVAEQEKVQHFTAVATAALREAPNGRELAGAISKALGEPVRILSGEEEARVIFRAFQRRLDLGPEPALGLDLGGGSLELAVGSAGGTNLEVTMPLGAVRLHGELVGHDPMTRAEARAVRERVRGELAPHVDRLLAHAPERAVATGGTVRALGRLLRERRASRATPGAVALSREALEALTQELVRSSHNERLWMRGVRPNRADLLPTGALILSVLAEELDLPGYTICDWGLREGTLLEVLGPRG